MKTVYTFTDGSTATVYEPEFKENTYLLTLKIEVQLGTFAEEFAHKELARLHKLARSVQVSG